jgi:hypothetical protein
VDEIGFSNREWIKMTTEMTDFSPHPNLVRYLTFWIPFCPGALGVSWILEKKKNANLD